MADTKRAQIVLDELQTRRDWWKALLDSFSPPPPATSAFAAYHKDYLDTMAVAKTAKREASYVQQAQKPLAGLQAKLAKKLAVRNIGTTDLDKIYRTQSTLIGDIASIEANHFNGVKSPSLISARGFQRRLDGALVNGKYDRALQYIEGMRPTGVRLWFMERFSKGKLAAINTDIEMLKNQVRGHRTASAELKNLRGSIGIVERMTAKAIRKFVQEFDSSKLSATNPHVVALMAANPAIAMVMNYAARGAKNVPSIRDITTDLRKGGVSIDSLQSGLDFLAMNLASDHVKAKADFGPADRKRDEYLAYIAACKTQQRRETTVPNGVRSADAWTALNAMIHDPMADQRALDRLTADIERKLARGVDAGQQTKIEADAASLRDTGRFTCGSIDMTLAGSRSAFNRAANVVRDTAHFSKAVFRAMTPS